MTAIREENGSWTSQFWYKDIYGKRKHKCKRGFEKKSDAETFELDYTNRARGSMDMRLADFVDVYAEDVKPTIREYTWATREYIINDKIIPKFGTKRMRDITVLDVIDWQNEILAFRKENGEPYSETYVRTVNSAFASIMNHAKPTTSFSTPLSRFSTGRACERESYSRSPPPTSTSWDRRCVSDTPTGGSSERTSSPTPRRRNRFVR